MAGCFRNFLGPEKCRHSVRLHLPATLAFLTFPALRPTGITGHLDLPGNPDSSSRSEILTIWVFQVYQTFRAIRFFLAFWALHAIQPSGHLGFLAIRVFQSHGLTWISGHRDFFSLRVSRFSGIFSCFFSGQPCFLGFPRFFGDLGFEATQSLWVFWDLWNFCNFRAPGQWAF